MIGKACIFSLSSTKFTKFNNTCHGYSCEILMTRQNVMFIKNICVSTFSMNLVSDFCVTIIKGTSSFRFAMVIHR